MENNSQEIPAFGRRRKALNYANDRSVLTLATFGGLGVWAASLFYANHEFDFYFLSAPSTRHAKNIGDSPRVSATIQDQVQEWEFVRGIQIEGDVRILMGDERSEAISIYEKKFSFLRNPPSSLKIALSRVDWYVLEASSVYFIDNSLDFGRRDKVY